MPWAALRAVSPASHRAAASRPRASRTRVYSSSTSPAIHSRSPRGSARRAIPISAVYTTLERLEQKGCVRSWIGEPTAERGGRRRKHFALRPAGARALREAYSAYTEMAAGLERRLKAL